jgi:type II secretory pathway pseudopilin PulG
LKFTVSKKSKKPLILIGVVVAVIVVIVVTAILVPAYLEASKANSFQSQIKTDLAAAASYNDAYISFSSYNNTSYLTTSQKHIFAGYPVVSSSTFLQDVTAGVNSMNEGGTSSETLYYLAVTRVQNVFYLQYVNDGGPGNSTIIAQCTIS